ncbi:hypothetical protein GC175_29080 [bacterium]|nr:hypothetical protein [bacterium]
MIPRVTSFISLLLLILLMTSCSVQPESIDRFAVFNEDLSGVFVVALTYNQYDYASMRDYYGGDPTPSIASEIAKGFGAANYKYEHSRIGNDHRVRVTTQFKDVAEYDSYYVTQYIALPKDQYPDVKTVVDSNLFRTQYIFEGTWLSGSVSDWPSSWSTVDVTEWTRLPGAIIYTNGDIQSDGQTVSWDLSYYRHTPYRLITEIRRVSELELEHIITLNRNMSGIYTLSLGFLPADYTRLRAYYGAVNIDSAVAREVAHRFGWTSHAFEREDRNGRIWIKVSMPFSSRWQLDTLYQRLASDAGQTAEVTVTRVEGTVNSTYRFEASPISLFEEEVSVRSTYIIDAPGRAVTTNGRRLEDTVTWNGASLPSMQVTTRAFNTPGLAIVLGLLFVVAVTGKGVQTVRSASFKSI